MTTKPTNDRYERLTNYYNNQLSRDNDYVLNRKDFDFLLLSHNKHLKLQLEHEALKREYQKVKRLQGIEMKLNGMSERKL
jgi:hypothetical protein